MQDDGLGGLVDGFSLPDRLAKTARHYLVEALKQTHGNKSRAAKLLGLNSYQNFLNWWSKYVGESVGQAALQYDQQTSVKKPAEK